MSVSVGGRADAASRGTRTASPRRDREELAKGHAKGSRDPAQADHADGPRPQAVLDTPEVGTVEIRQLGQLRGGHSANRAELTNSTAKRLGIHSLVTLPTEQAGVYHNEIPTRNVSDSHTITAMPAKRTTKLHPHPKEESVADDARYGYRAVTKEIQAFIDARPRGTQQRLAEAAFPKASPQDATSAFRHCMDEYRGERFSFEEVGRIAEAAGRLAGRDVGAPAGWPFLQWGLAEAAESVLRAVRASCC